MRPSAVNFEIENAWVSDLVSLIDLEREAVDTAVLVLLFFFIFFTKTRPKIDVQTV